jgi:hypothetical protein
LEEYNIFPKFRIRLKVDKDKISFKKIIFSNKNIWLLIILLGVIIFNYPSTFFMKMGITYIIIGILLYFLTKKETFYLNSWDDKSLLFMIAWVIIIFFFSWNLDVYLFIIITILGILIIEELLEKFTTIHFKRRFYILITFFVLLYSIILLIMMGII